MAQFVAQLFVCRALLFAWNVLFLCAGRSAISFYGSHRGTLALPRPRGWLLHVAINSVDSARQFNAVRHDADVTRRKLHARGASCRGPDSVRRRHAVLSQAMILLMLEYGPIGRQVRLCAAELQHEKSRRRS